MLLRARRLRSNREAWLGVAQDDIVDRLERRIARYTFLPAANGEPLHVMQYLTGQGYGARACSPSNTAVLQRTLWGSLCSGVSWS